MSARRRDESGIALLVVLLTITLLTIVVLEFTDYAQVETNHALSARNALQATYLARSGINVAEALVSYDGAISPGSDGEQDLWAKPYPPLPIGDGTAAIRMRDEARFLNLNEMVSERDVLRARSASTSSSGCSRVLGDRASVSCGRSSTGWTPTGTRT